MTQTQQPSGAIGWIGVGKMGRPMAVRLIEAGLAVTICDPAEENRRELQARGAATADSPAALAGRSDIVFSTIPNDAVLEDMVFGGAGRPGLLDGARPGLVLVEMSTVSPAVSQRVAQALAGREVRYLRCPVSGSTAMAQAGTLTALASGDPAAWDIAAPLIDRLAARRFYLGPAEEARFMKLVLNTLVGATAAILAEALALGERGGLAPAQMMDVIAESAVASPLLSYKRDMVAAMDFAPAFSVEQMLKDFRLITEAGMDGRIPMPATVLIRQQYEAAAAAGHAHRDFFALVDWIRGAPRPDDPT